MKGAAVGLYGKAVLASVDDPRIRKAAEALGCEIPAIIGVLALVGGALARDTRDGVIRGSVPWFLTRHSGVMNAEKIADALKEAGLVVERDGGHYLRGWKDLYMPLIKRRESNSSAQKRYRRKHYGDADVSMGGDRERRGEEKTTSKTTPRTPPATEPGPGQPPATEPPPTPEAPETAGDGGPPGNGTTAGSALPSTFLAELSLAGIRLHGRAGVSLHVWTGAIASVLESGATQADVLEHLKASKACDPPHVALQALQARHGSPRTRIGAQPPIRPDLKAKYAGLDDVAPASASAAAPAPRERLDEGPPF